MTKKQEKLIELIGNFSTKTYDEDSSMYIINYYDDWISVTYRIDKYYYDELSSLQTQPTNKKLIKLWKLIRTIENDRSK